MVIEDFIRERIPHRPPFLWVDRVTEVDEDRILAEKHVPDNLELFQGHYPEQPILPGVLVCEALFQTGALLISEMLRKENNTSPAPAVRGIPVLTRIQGARFKRMVYPGDNLELEARVKERVSTVWFMKAAARVEGRTTVKVEFACTLTT